MREYNCISYFKSSKTSGKSIASVLEQSCITKAASGSSSCNFYHETLNCLSGTDSFCNVFITLNLPLLLVPRELKWPLLSPCMLGLLFAKDFDRNKRKKWPPSPPRPSCRKRLSELLKNKLRKKEKKLTSATNRKERWTRHWDADSFTNTAEESSSLLWH